MKNHEHKIITTEVQETSVVPTLGSFENDLNSSLIDVPSVKIVNSISVENEVVKPIQSELDAPESKSIFSTGPVPKPYDQNFITHSQNHLPGFSLLLGRTTIYLYLLEQYDLKFNYLKKYKEDYLDVLSVSEILLLSRSSIYRLIKTKKIKASKIYNREWYIKMSDVDVYIRKYIL